MAEPGVYRAHETIEVVIEVAARNKTEAKEEVAQILTDYTGDGNQVPGMDSENYAIWSLGKIGRIERVKE